MRVFYRKEFQTNRVREIVFDHKSLTEGFLDRHDKEDVIEFGIFSSYTDDDENIKTILRKTCLKFEYIELLKIIAIKLGNHGWKESFEETIESKYSTYRDSKPMSCKVSRTVDSLESIKDLIPLLLPVYLHVKPEGFIESFFDGEFRNTKLHGDIPKLINRAEAIFNAIRLPFNCYVNLNTSEIIVTDVMAIHSTYEERLNILEDIKYLTHVIKPKRYEDIDRLWKDYSEIKNYDVVIVYSKANYIPGTSMANSYMISAGELNEALVLDINEHDALCIDTSGFDTLFQKKVNKTVKVLDIIKYKEDMNAVTIKI